MIEVAVVVKDIDERFYFLLYFLRGILPAVIK